MGCKYIYIYLYIHSVYAITAINSTESTAVTNVSETLAVHCTPMQTYLPALFRGVEGVIYTCVYIVHLIPNM